jgi:hypothetical protein
MRHLIVIAALCLGTAACNNVTTGSVAGGTAGAVTGAAVAGPVGALVGGTVGATAGAATGAVTGVATAVSGQPGLCYATDRRGNIRVDRAGEPVVVRC